MWLEHMCKVCARCALLLRFWGLRVTTDRFCVFSFVFIICLLFLEVRIAISLGFKWGGHFLCSCRCRNYDDFLLQFIHQNAPKLMLGNASWHPVSFLGGYLGSRLFLPDLETRFDRFGSYPNHCDFLSQFICQNVLKLILVTLAPIGPSGGLSL